MKTIFYQLMVLCAMNLLSQQLYAETVKVTINSTSGIRNANLTATLDDGTVLGFYDDYASYGYDLTRLYFCGAISQQTEISIPDSVLYNSKRFVVKYVGSYIGYDNNENPIYYCDFDNAENVTSVILPTTITRIYTLPASVTELHVKSYMDYSIFSGSLLNVEKFFVPEDAQENYFKESKWYNDVLILAEGTEPSKITINMTKAGEFAQLLLEQTNYNWLKVNELTVIGDLNSNDLNVFERMYQLTKLDLSHANIADIPNKFCGDDDSYNSTCHFRCLKELVLPEVNKIGNYAFSRCSRLKSITIPKVNSIGEYAFIYCKVPYLALPEGLTFIGNYAFYGSYSNSITIPEGVTTIGNYAFSNSNIESITIPETVTEISERCFQNCKKLQSVTIPASVTKIGYEAFRESGLTTINLPGVETIGSSAFYGCNQLAEVKFAEGLTSFESSDPFQGCTALTEIDLPSTFNYGYDGLFRGCKNIKKVICRAIIPPSIDSKILYNCDKTDVKLYVPAMSIDKYRVETGWKTFYTILPMEDKISNVDIYNDVTIDDASQFTTDCNLTLRYRYYYDSNYDVNRYYIGAADYTGSTTFSMHDYNQNHNLGYSNSNNPYSYSAYFTSLISNGTMRADNVQTKLRTNDTKTWYFISLPYDVKVSDITYTDDTQFAIRKYSGLNRAMQSGSTWLNLTADSVMHAYEGYILRCNKQYADFIFPAINNTNKNKVFEKESVVMPLGEYISEFEHNRSWNLIGNPYPCYYDTRYMDSTAPITIWNRYNSRYDAYSPVDDSFILHPAQSFFVQCPVGQASITFDKAGRQKNATVRELPSQVRKRIQKNADRKVYNIILSDGTTEDRTRFVLNEEASCCYELDKDASKFIADDNAAMLLYTEENGVKYAINERPLANGIINLGFYAPTEGEYTLSLNTIQGNNPVLIDHNTNTEVTLSVAYHFYASPGFNDSRFSLTFDEATDIGFIENNDMQISVENGIVSANTAYNIFTIDGRLVGNYSAGNTAVLSKGVYVINCKDVKRKIVVK